MELQVPQSSGQLPQPSPISQARSPQTGPPPQEQSLGQLSQFSPVTQTPSPQSGTKPARATVLVVRIETQNAKAISRGMANRRSSRLMFRSFVRMLPVAANLGKGYHGAKE